MNGRVWIDDTWYIVKKAKAMGIKPTHQSF
jgi:hypothetical protein